MTEHMPSTKPMPLQEKHFEGTKARTQLPSILMTLTMGAPGLPRPRNSDLNSLLNTIPVKDRKMEVVWNAPQYVKDAGNNTIMMDLVVQHCTNDLMPKLLSKALALRHTHVSADAVQNVRRSFLHIVPSAHAHQHFCAREA